MISYIYSLFTLVSLCRCLFDDIKTKNQKPNNVVVEFSFDIVELGSFC